MNKYHEVELHSFGGKNRLSEFLGKKQEDEVVSKSDKYTRFKQHRKPKKYSPLFVHNRRELFHSVVVVFTNEDMVKVNN